MKKTTLLLLIFTLTVSITTAQEQNCSQNLEDAKRAYYNGQLREVYPTLEKCLEQLSRDEQSEAFKLLTDTYLILGEDAEAESHMQSLLKVDPTYELRESDLAEFRTLFTQYHTPVKYAYGLVVGFQRPDFIIMKHHSYSSDTKEPDDYAENPGLILGIVGEYAVAGNLLLNGGLQFENASFEQEEEILQYQSVFSRETYSWLSLPLSLRYILPLGTWSPFIGGGFLLRYLLFVKADLDHSPLEPDFIIPFIGFPEEAVGYDISPQRKDVTGNWMLSAGLQRKIDRYQIEGRFTYLVGIHNLVKTSERFNDRSLLDQYAYVPDDFRMNSYQVSISVSRISVNPVKK